MALRAALRNSSTTVGISAVDSRRGWENSSTWPSWLT
uniref:OPR4 n=1 Tax=Arundo donax TaxID=35708 RepID=A0A0A8ZV40_ARUDO